MARFLRRRPSVSELSSAPRSRGMGSVVASCLALRRGSWGVRASVLTTQVLVTWSGSLSGSGQVGVVGHSLLVTSPPDPG
ncbi:hypothetical protein DI270_007165 [Microbispora triticiradicis]|uniref:Uncharacterized protein n=1 Tax=Microbispora triticiradicis TaxID=2200763 RepID=A0ABX9LPA0_9ACTN|nr:hypothetical protein DI270_007165 [Microbispora triticiradicis]